MKKNNKGISVAEIQSVSRRGIWLFVADREFFLSFAEYPWFRHAMIDQIYDFQFEHGKHLHWPTLDVDVDLESLKNIAATPLIYT